MRSNEKVIKTDQLTCEYGDKVILDSVFFEAFENEVLVILGPGGSGKSTILNILSENVSESLDVSFSQLEINSQLSYMKQSEVFLENTFEEAFKANHLQLEEELEKHWKSNWLRQKLLSFGSTLKTDLPENYFKLLQITLFLSKSKDSKILLIDEPEVKLYDNLNFIIDKVNDLKKEKTIVIVTHNIEFTRKVADRVLYLSYGKVIENSAVEDFFNSDNPDVKYILKMGC